MHDSKSVTKELCSPTVEYFDRLIAEQDCFEISLRQERVKNKRLTDELNQTKISLRKEILKQLKDIDRLQQMLKDRDSLIKDLELKNAEQKLELQSLKAEATKTRTETPPVLFQHKVPDVAAQAVKSVVQESDIDGTSRKMSKEITPPPSPPIRTNFRFRKAASIVAQLVQGFEAVAAANNQGRISEPPRRRRSSVQPPQTTMTLITITTQNGN